MSRPTGENLNSTEYLVLLALAGGELYGYAICRAVEADSGGEVRLHAGSLYRILGRLLTADLVEELDEDETPDVTHPGHARRYYRLTKSGRAQLRAESNRLSGLAALAARRLRVRGGRA